MNGKYEVRMWSSLCSRMSPLGLARLRREFAILSPLQLWSNFNSISNNSNMAEYWKSAVSHSVIPHITGIANFPLPYSLASGANNARSSFATRHSRRPNMKPVQNTRVASSAFFATSTETMNNSRERHSERKVRLNGYDRLLQAVPRKAIPMPLRRGRRPPLQHPNPLIDRSAWRSERNKWRSWRKWE